jgi:DNA processing protein
LVVLSAGPTLWRTCAGATATQALAKPPKEVQARLLAAQAWLASGERRQVLTVDDPRFPPDLLQTEDPPLLLYVQGDPACLVRPSVAIVGSRHPSPQGAQNAHAFALALGGQGWVVVSGLALGVDAAAHEGALAAGAATVAVVGTGLDRVYPARHRELAHRIERQGALVSEYAPGTPPLPAHFPQRNRIIAGLSRGTLVVEAALQSGSLITARLASEAGREVFAIPGSIHAPQAKGCHQLLKQGAKLVETAEDIVEELRGSAPIPAGAVDHTPSPSSPAAALEPPEPLLDAMGHDPASLDALQARTGWPTAELSARLMTLELEGRVARLPGGLYQRLVMG